MGKVIGKTYSKKRKGGNGQTQTPPAQTPPAQTPPENGVKQDENGEK